LLVDARDPSGQHTNLPAVMVAERIADSLLST